MIAPTGQTEMQFPQYSQSNLPPEKGSTWERPPLPMTEMADAPCTPPHILTHLVHTMHLSMFLTITGSSRLSGAFLFFSLNRLVVGPYFSTR